MFLTQFINIAVLLLVVNGGVPFLTYKEGEYFKSFGVDWYKEVGFTLTITMILNVFTPHIASLGFGFLKYL